MRVDDDDAIVFYVNPEGIEDTLLQKIRKIFWLRMSPDILDYWQNTVTLRTQNAQDSVTSLHKLEQTG